MPTFEILPGLPPYGSLPISFSPDGKGAHREGLVVRFPDAACGPWVGNFQPGIISTEQKVMPHPNGAYVLVFADGNGYAVNPDTMELVDLLGEEIIEVLTIPGTNDLLISSLKGVTLSRLSADGWAWRSGELTFGGLSNLHFDGAWVIGEESYPDLPTRQVRVSLQTGKEESFLAKMWNGIRG